MNPTPLAGDSKRGWNCQSSSQAIELSHLLFFDIVSLFVALHRLTARASLFPPLTNGPTTNFFLNIRINAFLEWNHYEFRHWSVFSCQLASYQPLLRVVIPYQLTRGLISLCIVLYGDYSSALAKDMLFRNLRTLVYIEQLRCQPFSSLLSSWSFFFWREMEFRKHIAKCPLTKCTIPFLLSKGIKTYSFLGWYFKLPSVRSSLNWI